jgi:cell division transport system permease protein
VGLGSVGSWVGLGRYFVRETFGNLGRHRLAHGITLLIVAVGALIFEVFALVSYNLSLIVEQGGSSRFIELYFKDEVPEARQAELLSRVRGLAEVESADGISKEQALESFRAQGYGQLLEGIEGNPLPASMLLHLRPSVGTAEARELAKKLGSEPEFSEWSDSGELAERLAAASSVVRALVAAVGLFLGLMLGFLIAGTVRLALESRRSEMEILELVGATSGFIRLPFVLEGTLLGLLGGGLSVGALWGLHRLLVASLDFGDVLLLGIGSVRFFGGWVLASFCVLSGVLGALAGLLVTGRADSTGL